MLWIRKVYEWTLAWAESAYASVALFFLAVVEASFFIIPPDLLLMALCAGKPKKSFWFASICALGSVVGGIIGYGIGLFLMDTAGKLILDTLHLHEAFKIVQIKYEESAALAIFAAAFTPIPYKVFTIAAGAFGISFVVFVLASAVGRSARFLVAALIYWWGPSVKSRIDKHFNLFTILFTIILLMGFCSNQVCKMKLLLIFFQ